MSSKDCGSFTDCLRRLSIFLKDSLKLGEWLNFISTVKSWHVADDFIILEDKDLIASSCFVNSVLAEKDKPDTLTPKDSLKLDASSVVVASNVVVQDSTLSIIHPYGHSK